MKTLNPNMRRIIVDFSKLNNNILDLLVEKFPEGYEESDIITFRNANYELVEAVEVRTEDTIYLVKISKRLADTMDNYDSDDDDDDSKEDLEKNEILEDDDQVDIISDEDLEEDFDE
jgi:DNA-directed RNA polymerase subunit delta